MRITGLSKANANGLHELDEVTLTVLRGLFSPLGTNGAVKSPPMHTLATLQNGDHGSVQLTGMAGPVLNIDGLCDKDALCRVPGELREDFGI